MTTTTALAPAGTVSATGAAADSQASGPRGDIGRLVTLRRTFTLTGLALIGLSATVAGCGTPSSDASVDPTTPTPLEIERPTAPIDDVFEVNGVGFHLHCTGQGDTTVLLLAGWDAGGDGAWSAVHPALAERARVCTYDRPGTGTSDAPSTDQTFESQATDLHALLEAAGEPGQYVVVGHSFGGAEAVTFASQYRDEVEGLMLLDASPATWPTIACSVPAWAPLCAVMHDPMSDPERLDVFPAFDAVAGITSLGDLPMIVVTAAHRTAPELTQGERERLDAAWADGVERWAALSTASTVVTVQDTGHEIQLEQPALVIDQVGKLLP
jgi:pimeloyl-ACP methyl ester carboxylesterase